MAVTFAVSDFKRGSLGDKRINSGLLTCTGTTTDNGDAVAPSLFGLHVLDELIISSALDSVSNPENAFLTVFRKIDPVTGGAITFHSQASAGATTPLAAITDGTSVANYVIRFAAIGT